MPNTAPSKPAGWAGTWQVPLGTLGRWIIGPLGLWLEHLPGEWRVAHEEVDTSDDGEAEVRLPGEAEDLLGKREVHRFAVSTTDDTVHLGARLADRSVVARPEQPFHLAGGSHAVVHISSPLWLTVSVGDPASLLLELPVRRPSDTWFGPSTREGELCYASRTFFRLSLDNVVVKAHRAVTAVRIENRASETLDITSLRLPVQHLALYQDVGGRFWTQDVTFERVRDEPMVSLRLKNRPPAQAPTSTLVTPSRQKGDGNVMVRALSALFR